MATPCYLDLCALKDDHASWGIVFATPSQYDVLNDMFFDEGEGAVKKAVAVHSSITSAQAAKFGDVQGADHVPPEGTLVVWFNDFFAYMLIAEHALDVVGRLFNEGDSVVSARRPGQSGVVLSTKTVCSLQPMWELKHADYPQTLPCIPRHGEAIRNHALTLTKHELVSGIDLVDLTPAADYHPGDPIMYKGWAGVIVDIEEEKTVRLFNNTVVVVGHEVSMSDVYKGSRPELYEPGGIAALRKADLRLGRWVYGRYDPNVIPRGVVVRVRAVRIKVDWQTHVSDGIPTAIVGRLPASPPDQWLGLDEIESPEFSHVHPRKISGRELSAAHYTATHTRFSNIEKARAKYGGRPETDILFKHGRQENLGFDMNLYRVAATKSDVTVKWPDGSVSTQCSLELQRNEDAGYDMLQPGLVVCTSDMKPLAENPTAGFAEAPRNVGVVQTWDQNTCIAKVRWFEKPHLFIEKGPDFMAMVDSTCGKLTDEIVDVSTYDLVVPAGVDFQIRDYVRLRPLETDYPPRDELGWLGVVTDIHPDATVQVLFAFATPPREERLHIDKLEVGLDAEVVLDQAYPGEESGDSMSVDGDGWTSGSDISMDDAGDAGRIMMGDRRGQDILEYFWPEQRPDDDAVSDHSSAWSTASEGGIDVAEDKTTAPKTFSATANGHANVSTADDDGHLQTTQAASTNGLCNGSLNSTEYQVPAYILHETPVPDYHRYVTDAHSIGGPTLRKVMKEHTIFSDLDALPPGIFVHSWEAKCNIFRAIIIGPTDTPYAHCPFVFDIHLPAPYPKEPPQVFFHHWPVRGGARRINPNLYEDGKVCLSLLNTWPGQSTEGWMPGKSTLLQILISIQSLILVPEPYYNEPGFEAKRNNLGTKSASVAYNEMSLLQAREFLLFAMQNVKAACLERQSLCEFEQTLYDLYIRPDGPRKLQQLLSEDKDLLARSEAADPETMNGRDGVTLISAGACLRLKKILKDLEEIEG